MQMMQDRPKKERMLRAYLNSDLAPLGFKGNSLSQLKFREFYVATPYRVIDKYHGHMHPLKSKIYFETLEKLGGQLVYDDEASLCGWMTGKGSTTIGLLYNLNIY